MEKELYIIKMEILNIKVDFKNGKKEGDGKFIFEDGNYYIGQFKDDLFNGKGIIYYKNGNIMYEGYLKNNKKEGHGKFIYENGNYYICQIKDDLRNGKGIVYYKNGNIMYEGDFKNGKKERRWKIDF